MIVLWGLTGDGPFDAVRGALERRSAPTALIDQRLVLDTSVDLSVDPRLRAVATISGDRVELDDATAVYWRTHDLRRVPAVVDATSGAGGDALDAAIAVEGALALWLEMTDARVVSRPSRMASNGSKPYQMEILRANGFAVPRTIVTTDPGEVRRFWTEHGAVIYKSVSSTRSIVARLGSAHLERIDQVGWCPTQFQQYVPGRDHRVHVVGDDVFACEILSDAEDYRYAALRGEAPPTVRSCALPADVAARCVELARSLELPFAGIDLRLAPDGRWFCFEVNPSPGFTYYEAHTGAPIADAVASLLCAEAGP